MGIQTIVDNATYITFDHKKIAAQSLSRSGRLLTAELASAVPFQITVGMHKGLTFSDNRNLLADLDVLDVTVEEEIDIGSTNSGLDYITKYQGDSTGIGSVTVNAATGTGGANIYLNCTAAGSGNVLFEKGDIIQPDTGYRYPYIVTAQVAHTTGSNVTIPVHRPVIPQESYTFSGKGLNVGVDCTWRVKLINKPSYSVVPHDRIEFNSAFELVETIRKGDG